MASIAVEQVRRGEVAAARVQVRAEHASGRILRLEGAATPAKAPGDVRVTLRDVTEEWTAAQALRDSEKRFESFLNAAPIGIAVVDAAGHLAVTNETFQRMVGYDSEELAVRSGVTAEHLQRLLEDPRSAGLSLLARRQRRKAPVEAFLMRAYALMQLRRLDECLETVMTGLKRFPDHPDLLNNAGVLNDMLKRPAGAETCFRKLTRVQPGHGGRLEQRVRQIQRAALLLPVRRKRGANVWQAGRRIDGEGLRRARHRREAPYRQVLIRLLVRRLGTSQPGREQQDDQQERGEEDPRGPMGHRFAPGAGGFHRGSSGSDRTPEKALRSITRTIRACTQASWRAASFSSVSVS